MMMNGNVLKDLGSEEINIAPYSGVEEKVGGET